MPLFPCRNPLLKIWYKLHLNYPLLLGGRFAVGNDEKGPVAIGEGLSSGPAAKEKNSLHLIISLRHHFANEPFSLGGTSCIKRSL